MAVPPIQSPLDQQAHDKIRGYNYQCWLTVEAWLELDEGDILFTETAEDFATFSASKIANIAQAKATAAKITLRSGDVTEAINHYWAFKKQKSGFQVHYSFISTSRATIEQGDPFNGTSGIALWQQASEHNDATKAALLLNFLQQDQSTRKKLESSLLQKLKTLSSAEFLYEFIRPIIWDIDYHDIDAVKSSVTSRLGLIAEKTLGVTSAHSSNLADTLFTTVHGIAESKEKVELTLSSLNATLQGHLAAVKTSINSIRSQDILAGTISGGTGLNIGWEFTDITPPLEIPDEFSRRDSALKDLKTKAESSPFILIEGSSGMGKSTLATIFAKSLDCDCLQFRSRGTELGRILRGIQECIWLISKHPRKITLIVDDLPWSLMDEGGMVILRALARSVVKKSAIIVFTNHETATGRELSSAGFNELVTISAPLMTESEITDLASRLGCTKESAKFWAPVVGFQTSKHPQLVHAHLIGLKKQGWPQCSMTSIQASTEKVVEEQTHAQRMLNLIDKQEIELLTRLSAYYGTFKRDHAMTIAESLEPLVGTNVTFGSLIGPWIEQQESGRYQITPLLGRSLLINTSTKRQQLINEAAADAIVSCKPLEARDAASALLNSIDGNASRHATGLIIQFLMAPEEHADVLFTHLSWIQFIKYDGAHIFEDDPALDYFIRILQFRVCAHVAPEKCDHFLTLCDHAGQAADVDSGSVNLEVILAVSIISSASEAVPFSRIFWAMNVIRSSIPAMVEELGDPTEKDSELNAKFGSAEDGCIFTLGAKAWQRASSQEGLKELFDFLKNRAEDESTLFDDLEILTKHAALALGAFDEIWLNESKQEEPNWERPLQLFTECMATAQLWKCELITACAARGISVIQDEYLDNTDEAARVLEGLDSDIPEVRSIIAEQKGKVSLSLKKYQDAQMYFEESIEYNPWREYTSSSTLIAYHNAGVSAAKAEHWKSSANNFWAAFKIAQDDLLWTRAVAFAADAGYSFWKYGDKEAAINCLTKALTLVEKMPSFESDLASLQVQKILGNMLLQLSWSNEQTAINKELSAPVIPGMCSNPTTNEEARKLTPPMIDFEWAFLLKIEFEHTQASNVWDNYSEELLKHSHPALKYLAWAVKARICIRSNNEEPLLSIGNELASSLISTAKARSTMSLDEFHSWGKNDVPITTNGRIETESPYPINFLLMSGITNTAFRGHDPVALIKLWKQDMKSGKVSVHGLYDWLDLVEVAYTHDLMDAFKVALHADTLWERWGAALKLVSPDSDFKHDPTSLLAASLALLIHGWHNESRYEMVDDTYALIDIQISALWKKACENRYAFCSPTLFIPDIRELAGNPTGTVAHIAELILTALPAIRNFDLPQEVINQVKQLRKPNGGNDAKTNAS